MNSAGEMVNTIISTASTADLKAVERLVSGLKGKLYGDRGYIGTELKQELQKQNIELITRQRKNMAAVRLADQDEHYLKQRNKIETLFGLLKGSYNLVTSKARSVSGYLAGMYASLCAYQLCHANKPKIAIYNEFP